MEVIDAYVVHSICTFYDPSYAFLPSEGMSRGILLLWNSVLWQMLDGFIGSFLVLILVCDA